MNYATKNDISELYNAGIVGEDQDRKHMATPPAKKPLDRFPIVRTSDVDEIRVAIGRIYGELRFLVDRDVDGFNAHGNHCQLNDIGISYASFGAPVHQSFPNFVAGYATQFAVAGSGWARIAGETVGINDGGTLIASPGRPGDLHYSDDYEEITVLLDPSAVQRKLGALVGAEVNGNLVFEPVLDLGNPVNRMWWRMVQFLICEAESREDDLSLAALGEIEQALIVIFLKANRHNFSHLLDRRDRDAAPRQVRLAEEYIEAHWNEPITIERLAQLTNVSARSIFHSFRKNRGYSPMAFVKQVRLRHARQMLVGARPGTTVAHVSYMCGFGNLGNFAKEYRNAFAELPSDTLRTARDVSAPG